MTKANFIVEMSNDARSIHNPNGLSPQEIADFLAEAGKPTSLVGRFGEGGICSQGFDKEAIAEFLSHDSSWFPPDASK